MISLKFISLCRILDQAMQVSVRAVTLTEDHKPSNKRERFRVEQRVQLGQQVLPVPVPAFDQKDEDFVQLYTHRYFGQTKSVLKSPEDSPTIRYVVRHPSLDVIMTA